MIATATDNRKWQDVYRPIAIFGCRLLSQSPGNTFIKLAALEKSIFTVGILMLFIIFSEIDIYYFRFLYIFYTYFAILPFPVVCRCLSRPVNTVFKLAAVDNLRFAVGISVSSVIVLKLAFPVCRPHCYFRLSINFAFIWGHIFTYSLSFSQ